MVPCDDRDTPFRRNNPVRTVQRMLEHGAGSNESAVLFWPVVPQPCLDHRLEPFTIASGEDNGPEISRIAGRIHDVFLVVLG
jgi:hypothetical protein